MYIPGNDYTGQTLYLLGRAFSNRNSVEYRLPRKVTDGVDSMRTRAMRKTLNCYQQSVYRNNRAPYYWLSIAIVYYMIDQPRDSLEALSRAIRLNPSMWESYYNLGVLVSSNIITMVLVPMSTMPSAVNQLTQRIVQHDHLVQVADALDAFQKCVELNPEAVRAATRATKLKKLLDSGIRGSAPTAEMIEPPLDHVSHTLPGRRDNLSLILNPKKVEAAISSFGGGSLSLRWTARSATVWNCVSQARAAGRYTCESNANSQLDCSAIAEQELCCTRRLRYAPPATTNVVLIAMFTVLQSPADKFVQVRIRDSCLPE